MKSLIEDLTLDLFTVFGMLTLLSFPRRLALLLALAGLLVKLALWLLARALRRLSRAIRPRDWARTFRPARRRRMRSAQPWPLRWRSQSHRFDDWLCELAMIEQFDPQRHEVRGMLRRAGEVDWSGLNRLMYGRWRGGR